MGPGIHALLTPLGHGLLNQRTIEGVHRYPVILEPTGQPTHGALSQHGSAVPIGDPGCETDIARLDEAHHHPGQGLQMPPIQPMFMLASHLHQRMRETRCAFHVYPPWKLLIPKSV
jgi:hypothetical protein